MASHPKAPAKVLCKYYMSNCCTKGNLCPFSHEWKDKPDMRCKYYIMGSCINGKKCRYDHIRPETPWTGDDSGKERQSSGLQVKGNAWGNVPRSVPAVSPVNLPSLSSATPSAPPVQKRMVTLREDPSRNPKKWVQAAEFVPGQSFHGAASATSNSSSESNFSKEVGFHGETAGGVASIGASSYSAAVGLGLDHFLDHISAEEAADLLCPFAEMGHCPFEVCEYLHGEVCDMCNRECLNPFDEEQRKRHRQECLEMHEREMERAFQAQESEDKRCAICMEYVVSKQVKSERRFGILQNCEHCFCLACIRKWRGSTHTGKRTIRACPLCRTVSYFIIPSSVWIENSDQKEKLKQEYRDNLGRKHCKYFNMGEDICPFGDSCFYKHELRDGTKVKQKPRIYETSEGERKVSKKTMLWDFLNTREEYAHFRDEEDEGGPAPNPSPSAPDGLTGPEDSNHNLFWLNYEPDIDDLDIL